MILHHDQHDIDYRTAIRLQTREITEEQMQRFEGYASEIFVAMEIDLITPATKDTPRRFIKALFDATEGDDGDPKLLKVFDTECRGNPDCRLSQVIEGPIPFFALCEHHALLFSGQAYVGYIVHENIIGISKLTRLGREAFLAALCRPGTDRSTDCRCLGNDTASSWRGHVSGSPSPVCRNERDARNCSEDAYHCMARSLCRGCKPAL